MFCQNCGVNNPDGATNCGNCGAPLQAQAQAPAQPVYQQPVYQQPVYPGMGPAPVVPGKGLGIGSMVVGIIALALFCWWYVAIPCAIIGAVLGGVGIAKAKQAGMKNGMAVAGLVCSCVALGIAVLMVILVAAGMAQVNAMLS